MGRKRKWTDQEFIEAIKDCNNFHQVARKIGAADNCKYLKRKALQMGVDITHFDSFHPYPYLVTDADLIEAWENSKTTKEIMDRIDEKYHIRQQKRQRTVWRHLKSLGLDLRKYTQLNHHRKKLEDMVGIQAVRRYIKNTRIWACESCGIKTWKDREIPLQVHHIDGNRYHNTDKNLQLLCPNCHSITDNYMWKNVKGVKVFK